MGGSDRIELLLGDEAPGRQPAGAVEIELRPVGRGLGEGDVGLGGRGGCPAAVHTRPGLLLLGAADVHGNPGRRQCRARLLETALGALAGQGDLGARAPRRGRRHGDGGPRLLDADLRVTGSTSTGAGLPACSLSRVPSPPAWGRAR
jgi:hypothetical protein